MHRASWTMLVAASLLTPAAGHADDAKEPVADTYSLSLLPDTSQAYWRDPGYELPWPLPSAIEIPGYSSESPDPIADLDFRDPGTFARISKLRELSLLTLAELGKTRLFFGVNDAGLFGFHLVARPRAGDARSVELARMPYLKSALRDISD